MVEEAASIFLKQCFDLWINPEIHRRAAAGLITPPIHLFAAEIVMWPNKPPIVRLNSEVRATFHAVAVRSIEAGEEITGADIQKIDGVTPAADEADAGHLNLLSVGDSWHIQFDFTYNSAKIAELIKAAEEFIESTNAAVLGRRPRSLIELAWSAAEILATALLIVHPTQSHKTHRGVMSQLHARRKNGVAGGEFARLLSELDKLRQPARYGSEPFKLDDARVQEIIASLGQMLAYVKQQAPARARKLLGE